MLAGGHNDVTGSSLGLLGPELPDRNNGEVEAWSEGGEVGRDLVNKAKSRTRL